MAIILRGFVALFLILSVCHAKRRYDGYQVLHVTTTTAAQVELLTTLEQDAEIDIWSNGLDHFDIMVSPEKLVQIKNVLAQYEATYTVLHANVQKDIDAEEARLAGRRTESSPFLIDYDDFNTYDDIAAELDEVVLRCPAALGVNCETFVIGQSFEGRDIKGIRIFRTDRVQRGIWVDSTIHAREWLAVATGLKILSHLVDDYSTDAQVQGLVDKYEWHYIPLSNPDGYEWTWVDDRLWRKNRSPNTGSACVGTDLNRNFDHFWNNAGTSESPCSETYGGSGPASEVEVQAAQAALNSRGSNLITSIHLHTYAQYWLVPWGHTNALGNCILADDHDDLMAAANAAADATENTHGTSWDRGNWCEVLYPASGSAQDYSKSSAGVKYTFTPELRGNSFIVAADQIQPSYEEVWNGVTAAIAIIDP
jgi:carboxypeptidase A2